MPREDCRPVQPGEGLAQPGDIVGERCLRELRRDDVVALQLQVLDDGAPAGSVGECAVDQHDVRLIGHGPLLSIGSAPFWGGSLISRARTRARQTPWSGSLAHLDEAAPTYT